MRRGLAALTTLGLVLGLLAGAPSARASVPGCATAAHAGGEWRHFGRDLANSRSQPAESTIGPSNVANLKAAWIFNPAAVVSGAGGFHNTPIIADGCLYAATNTGWVISANADTAAVNWSRQLAGNSTSLIGGVITGSPAVANGRVYVGVSRNNSPYVVALSQATGSVLWSTTVDTTNAALLVTGPVSYKGDTLLFQGFMGAESNAAARGGYAILDPATGAILAKGYTIPDADYALGYRGASIWGTAAVDGDNYIYAPTGNPASKKLEHANSNAIVKIDGDPGRSSFGTIVDSYKGLPDNYVEGVNLYDQPACAALGQVAYVAWSLTCLQLDLDFGAAPNLFVDAQGDAVVGALQKAGVYHSVRTSTMDRKWTAIVGTPGFSLNANSSAVAGGRIFVPAQEPSQMWGLSDTGAHQWAAPIGDGLHFQAASHANGVVYTTDVSGNVRAFDAALGLPLWTRPVSLDRNQPTADSVNSTGIAIARNTVYVAVGSFIVAYRL